MIILAIDLGKVRTGIAVCDKNEILATPVCTVKSDDTKKTLQKVLNIIKDLNVNEIVVGLPRNMDGSEGESAKNAREFANKLHLETGLKVILQDERLSTVAAHNYLNQTNTRGKKRKSLIDTVSATIILQNYLDFKKQNKNKTTL